MARVPYSKPPLSYSEQLLQLKSRGLEVQNDSKALHLLESISYYRLSGYWYPMLAEPKTNHIFKAGSSFNNAFKLYCFDRELRKLILGELEKIEIAVRAKMIYILWHNHGAFWQNNIDLFADSEKFDTTLKKIVDESHRSHESFIKAFKRKYSDRLPPACMILEISSFGNLSNLYGNLKPGLDRREIANYFGVDDSTFASWLHSFTYVRNLCAHHARLWNKRMGISPQIPTTPIHQFISTITLPNPIAGQPPILNNNSAYFLLSMIIYLLNIINPKHTFKSRLLGLLKAYPMVDVKAMGFPEGWEEELLWSWKKVIDNEKWHNKILRRFKLKK